MKLFPAALPTLCKKIICYELRNNERADLQGLRGVAALFVLIMHLRPHSCHLGFIGVDMFFVLSGFFMARILLEKSFTLWSVWAFYVSRFKRIVPLYMLLAVITYTFGYLYIPRLYRKEFLDDLAWMYTYSSNLQPIFEKFEYWDQLSTCRIFLHTWSLGVELQYYLVVPILMGVASRCEHNIRVILFVFLGVFSITFQLYAPPSVAFGFLLSRIWQFMCGSIAYELSKSAWSSAHYKPVLRDGESKSGTDRKQDELGSSNEITFTPSIIESVPTSSLLDRSLITDILLLLLSLSVFTSPEYIYDDIARICSTFATGLVVFLNTKAFCLTNMFVIYCGKISYSLYLIHWPVITAAWYYVDSKTLTPKDTAIVLLVSFMLSALIHHTFEKFFMRSGAIAALTCVTACYAIILGTKSMYNDLTLGNISYSTSKIEHAITWNLIESRKGHIALPCRKDNDTQLYTKFKEDSQLRCVAKGNGTASILLIGNTIAYRAYPLIHGILEKRYHTFRLYSTSSCPPLSDWCSFSSAMRKVVQHEKPDVVWYMHHCLFVPFVGPFANLKDDRIYKRFQKNINFISNFTKYIVIDMPYYVPSFNVGAMLARRLQLGLLPNDEFVVTLQALFVDGLFYLYDPKTLLVRIGDRIHMTSVGLELLRPLYTRTVEKLLHILSK